MLSSKLKKEELDFLFSAVLSLKDKKECADFFEDLCTISELIALSQRLKVAKMLKESHVYSDIVEKTGASTATISRVNRCLLYGSGGYNTVLERLGKNG
jgi:TrpR-related protein YerC/YecD